MTGIVFDRIVLNLDFVLGVSFIIVMQLDVLSYYFVDDEEVRLVYAVAVKGGEVDVLHLLVVVAGAVGAVAVVVVVAPPFEFAVWRRRPCRNDLAMEEEREGLELEGGSSDAILFFKLCGGF